jgi:hypothetical protein
VKTRTLILLAMACGLAILVAGSVFLWRVIANKDELTVPDIKAPGQSQQVGPVTATVTGSDDVGDVVVVQVHLASSDHIGDAGSGWSLVVSGDTSARAPVAVPPGAGAACAGTTLEAGSAADCAVAFPTGDGDRFVAFAVGPVQRQWKLEPPLP